MTPEQKLSENNKRKLVAAVLAALCVSGAGVSAQEQQGKITERVCENHLVSITPEGKATRGSKKALVDAVESGKSIRVGFGLGRGTTGGFSLTHWFEAGFLTVLVDDVFSQTPIIHSQRPVRPDYDVTFPEASSRWVATLGTNGKLHSKGLNSEKVAEFKVYSWWCLSD